jgi:ubiquinone/menaquinone biosynthesis C-methylase UbiE
MKINKFYESIADYYDYIFDPDDSAEVINELYLNSKPCRIIDIGCATGKLAAGLAGMNHEVTAIDLDSKMIETAEGKYKQKGMKLKFMRENMLEIGGIFEAGHFEAAVCVGNTIVHLQGPEKITEFFSAVNKILKPGAVFIAQILNYDRIISQKINKLALIENDKIKFERYYDLDTAKNGGMIIFQTKLTVKGDGGAIIENESSLYPAKKDEIEKALTTAGFCDINFYSDIDKTLFSIDKSGPLAFSAVK